MTACRPDQKLNAHLVEQVLERDELVVVGHQVPLGAPARLEAVRVALGALDRVRRHHADSVRAFLKQNSLGGGEFLEVDRFFDSKVDLFTKQSHTIVGSEKNHGSGAYWL